MILESLLAYAHIAALLGMVVFISSEAALCRGEWLNAAVVERLVRVDLLYLEATAAVALTGLARAFWGVKGASWYWTDWLLHLKLALFVVVVLMSLRPAIAFRRWRAALRAGRGLPPADEVVATRRWVMRAAHLVPVIPLAAVFLARGYGH